MKKPLDWDCVFQRVRELARITHLPDGKALWRARQQDSLNWITTHLREEPGVLIADEVGLGKTRLAIALAVCVASCGGRIAILIPPGLTSQWRDDELLKFCNQLQTLKLPWLAQNYPAKVLRTYHDLFGTDQDRSAYRLSHEAPFVLLSHRFGLPQRLATVKRDELWGLPFAVKREVVDGRKVSGAGKLALSPQQQDAVQWLAANMPARLRKRLAEAKLGRVSSSAFDVPEHATLFRALIGELIGDFDLVIVDEAHKSRAGAEEQTKAAKAAATMLQSRLTLCLNEILLRKGSTTAHAKRVALTATPMEMNERQWADIFHRIGLPSDRVDELNSVVTCFASAVRELGCAGPAQIARLEDEAARFQKALRPLVTRRRWLDHPTVQQFTKQVPGAQGAHPHRRVLPAHITPLSDLSPTQRQQLAYTESIGVTSKGIDTLHTLKRAGSRYSQGMPLIAERAPLARDETSERPTSEVDTRAKSDQASGARLQRQAYWLDRLAETANALGPVKEKARWSLQWHPRIEAAIKLIESLSGEGKKVLVFGEFVESIRALDRALNIRYYLRHVRDSQPIPVPVGVGLDDPDLLRWLESPDIGMMPAQRANFFRDAKDLGERYTHDRAGLREICRAVVGEFLADIRLQQTDNTRLLTDELTVWLVQSLCAGDELSDRLAGERRAETQRIARDLLDGLSNVDISGMTAEDEKASAQPFDWAQAIREQLNELERDRSGNAVFRMSPFSQLLFGDTKTSTRRVRQHAFNHADLNPQVLIGQSAVASEGLNLHRACRTVVLLHLDWNPARIEQQIGRVDRQDSQWMTAFDAWDGQAEPPRIDIHTLSIAGTYDTQRADVIHNRARILRSQLFGDILPADELAALDPSAKQAVERIRIDLRPRSDGASVCVKRPDPDFMPT